MLDVNEAARVAQRSPETVRRWVWSGKLAAQRRGHKLMIAPSDLAALLASHDTGSTKVTLAEWAATARGAMSASGRPPRGSAADLVLGDRRRRSEGADPQ